MDSGLVNKTVLITGASGGIGQEVARSFAGEGANVAVHYFRGADRAEELLAQLTIKNKLAVGADLRDEAEVSQMFEQVESGLGPVDVLVANAGFWPPDDTPLSQMTLEQWNETVATDLTSVFLCVREFLRRVETHSIEAPSVVMIGSTAGHFGEAGHADYAASKSGLMYGLLATLKNEIPRIARLGRINAVCPGWTMTPMARKFSAQTRMRWFERSKQYRCASLGNPRTSRQRSFFSRPASWPDTSPVKRCLSVAEWKAEFCMDRTKLILRHECGTDLQ